MIYVSKEIKITNDNFGEESSLQSQQLFGQLNSLALCTLFQENVLPSKKENSKFL